MAKDEYYVQCKLRKGKAWLVSNIPEKFAVKGKILKLKDIQSEWEDGWEVMEIYTKFPKEVAFNNATLWRYQREASDI